MSTTVDSQIRSTVIAMQLHWQGAYAISTSAAGTWSAIPVAAPDALLEASGPVELNNLIKRDYEARAERAAAARPATRWAANSSC